MSKYDNMYLKIAKVASEQSEATRLKVGCVFVRDDAVLSIGFNGTPPHYHTNKCEGEDGQTLKCVVHAEQNAILKSAREGVSLKDATVYITHSPCHTCSSMLASVGVKRVVFVDNYRDSGVEYLTSVGIKVEQRD